MIIDYKVDSQILRRTSRNLIVADSIKYLAVRFNFSDEWKGTKKTVVFYMMDIAIMFFWMKTK